MRARNREINIFNMSLLDILTGMLGAFLFLMLGLLPYYAKVSKNNIDPAEVEQLRKTVEQQNQKIADQQKEIDDLKKQLTENPSDPEYVKQLQARLQKAEKDRDFWQASQQAMTIISQWDSEATDIDVLVLTPGGDIITPKQKDVVLGKKALYDGDDSHGPGYATRHEGLVVYFTGAGDYLVFYRVPANANPATYANLQASYMYFETMGTDPKDGVQIHENGLGPSHADMAAPGGLYAWTVLTYDPQKYTITVKDLDKVRIPRGITVLHPNSTAPVAPTPAVTAAPRTTQPRFPFTNPRPTAPVAPVATPSPAGGGGPPPPPGF